MSQIICECSFYKNCGKQIPLTDQFANIAHRAFSIEKEISVVGFRQDEDQVIASGNSVEVRGTVASDSQLTYSDLNRFDGDFDMGAYEQMLEYYHGICKHLTVSAE